MGLAELKLEILQRLNNESIAVLVFKRECFPNDSID
jgi:hypothetical protein